MFLCPALRQSPSFDRESDETCLRPAARDPKVTRGFKVVADGFRWSLTKGKATGDPRRTVLWTEFPRTGEQWSKKREGPKASQPASELGEKDDEANEGALPLSRECATTSRDGLEIETMSDASNNRNVTGIQRVKKASAGW